MGMIQHGDALDLLRTMPSNSVDAIVTDPPYGIDMLMSWDESLPDKRIWAECFRVMKPGAHMAAFGFHRSYHRLACQIEDAGFELRETCMFMFGTGFPKNHKMGDGLGTAMKPGWEPIVIVRKPFKGSTRANIARHGTGGMNIDACRITAPDPEAYAAKGASVVGLAGPRSNVYGGDSRPRRDSTHEAGRHPANVILDPMSALALAESTGNPVDRFFYCAKTSRAEREMGLEYRKRRNVNDGRATSIDNPFQRGDSMRANVHPMVKPVALMRWLCRLITPPGGLVLDPFCGSGSTGIAAALEGFSFIGYELDAEYVEIAEARIWHAISNPQDYDPELNPADEDERQIRIPGT